MRRGRPPYPDLLTPREQQVLSLLREGLSNPEIAQCLGISRFGVKYHVSEILSKLGVSTREEAAAWEPDLATGRRGRLLPVLVPLALPFKKLAAVSPLKVASAVVIAAAIAGIALLAAGVLIMSARGGPAPVDQEPGVLGGIAYIQGGNLFVRSIPGGDPLQLTSDGEASAPRWSPSGEWLMAGLEVMRADGSDRRPAPLCAGWSPVADEMLCIVDGRGTYDAVRIDRPDGSTVRRIEVGDMVRAQLPGLDVRNASCPHWSPDGTRIACVVTTGPPAAQTAADGLPYAGEYSSLWLVEADGSDARQLFEAPVDDNDGGDVGILAWSEDGETIVFALAPFRSNSIPSDGLRLHTVAVSSGAERTLDAVMLPRDELMSVSATGDLAITEGAGRETWAGKRIARIDASTGALTYLTEPATAAFAPAWSPDGSMLAYVSAPDIGRVGGGDPAREGAAKRRIWLMNADGSGKRQLTNDPAYRDESPVWSQDGQYVMFTRLDAEDHASLWVVPVAGGDAWKLADLSRPAPSGPAVPLWFGFYGHINWQPYFEWWQP